MPYVFSHMPCVIFPVCFHLWEIGCQSEKTASPRTLVLSFFCHFLKADRRKRGTEQVSTLQEKLFVPETPRNGTC